MSAYGLTEPWRELHQKLRLFLDVWLQSDFTTRDLDSIFGVILAIGMTTEEKYQRRLQELKVLDKERLKVHQQIELYQCTSRKHSTKVKWRTFKEEDLVLVVKRSMILTHKINGKFKHKSEGPFMVETVYSNGAHRLINQE